jgi:hypothetical protein
MAYSKKELLHFLESKAFDPILNTKPDRYSHSDREALEHVQRATQAEKERYQSYSTAEEVRQRLLEDVSSSAAEKVNRELDRLKLPKLPDLKDEFLELCQRLGVGPKS